MLAFLKRPFDPCKLFSFVCTYFSRMLFSFGQSHYRAQLSNSDAYIHLLPSELALYIGSRQTQAMWQPVGLILLSLTRMQILSNSIGPDCLFSYTGVNQ